MGKATGAYQGFTLIELSIVLVIIGLIIGGVLVGQDLIRAAGVRATISQIEKYNTAANTFREKYSYLPGDIPDPQASSFGFQRRVNCKGQGDGNGLIEGYGSGSTCSGDNGVQDGGETLVFWVDLSTAHLIDGTFASGSTTVVTNPISFTTTPNINQLFPAAKIGRGNYIYVYPGGAYVSPTFTPNGYNYFGISAITYINQNPTSNPALTALEAYSIDSKIDDGLPQYGRVTAQYLGGGGSSGYRYYGPGTANGGGVGNNSAPDTIATTGSAATCFDNVGVSGATQKYSLDVSGGSNVTCALSFQMQAGD